MKRLLVLCVLAMVFISGCTSIFESCQDKCDREGQECINGCTYSADPEDKESNECISGCMSSQLVCKAYC